MNRPATGVRLTWEDFARFPEDGQRHELIDGEHLVTPTPVLRHQAIVMNLGLPIAVYLKSHPIGTVFNVPVDVIFSRHDVVEPDLLYFSHERRATFEPSDWVKGVPNLVAEVASPSTKRRDETVKRRLYERFGVDEYWLVQPESETVLVLRLKDGAYRTAGCLRANVGDVLTTPLLPEFSLSIGDVFAR